MNLPISHISEVPMPLPKYVHFVPVETKSAMHRSAFSLHHQWGITIRRVWFETHGVVAEWRAVGVDQEGERELFYWDGANWKFKWSEN